MYEPKVDDRVEWNPHGDVWIAGTVTHVLLSLVAIVIEGGQELVVDARHLRHVEAGREALVREIENKYGAGHENAERLADAELAEAADG